MKKTKAAASLEYRTPVKEVADARPAPEFKPPLKPRRGLFYALLGLLAVWIAVLVVMYFTTVYPTRKQQPTEIPAAPLEGETVPRR
jgi:hypothetical protein